MIAYAFLREVLDEASHFFTAPNVETLIRVHVHSLIGLITSVETQPANSNRKA